METIQSLLEGRLLRVTVHPICMAIPSLVNRTEVPNKISLISELVNFHKAPLASTNASSDSRMSGGERVKEERRGE